MKHQWLACLVVGVLSLGAGVAIAGLPNNVPVDASIIPPTTTEAPEPAAATTTTIPATTVPETTTSDPTDPEELTTVYSAAGFEEAALRMADDFDLPPESRAPNEDSPSVTGLLADIELLVYIGRDRA